MNRLLFVMVVALVESAAIAKGKKSKAPACPACPACPSTTTAASSSASSAGANTSATPYTSPTGPASPFPMEDRVLQMLNYTESENWEAAAKMFAYGMTYITNGQRYDIDLSQAEAVKSVPMRYRTNFVFNRLNSHEVWGYCVVRYAADNRTNPEMIILHFDKDGLIDMFSHIEPKAAQCNAIVPQQATRLALMRVDGTIVDAPQDQLQAMMDRQMAAAAAAQNATSGNATSIRSNATSIRSNATSIRSNATSIRSNATSTRNNATSSNTTSP